MREVNLCNTNSSYLFENVSEHNSYNCFSSILQSRGRVLSSANSIDTLLESNRADGLILGTFQKKLTDKQQVVLLSELDGAYLSGLDRLNGNHNRRVIGSISKRNALSIIGTVENNKFYNKYLDERQLGFLESVGPVIPFYESSTLKAFTGKDNFRHNPDLTYAFEVLKREALERGEVLAFITVQLSEEMTTRLYAETSPVTYLRDAIKYRLKKLLSSPLRAVIVLERSSSVKYTKSSCDGSGGDLEEDITGLNAHLVLVGKKEEIDILKDINVTYSLRSLSTPAANAIVIKYNYEIRRLNEGKGGLRPYCIVKTTLPIDGGVMDYLAKGLHDPISSAGCKNFAFIGIRGAVKSLWEEQYIKQRKLDELVSQIRVEINSGTHPGNIQLRVIKVLEE